MQKQIEGEQEVISEASGNVMTEAGPLEATYEYEILRAGDAKSLMADATAPISPGDTLIVRRKFSGLGGNKNAASK